MKKEYRKPQIAFDSYVVATNVAICTWGGGYENWSPIDIGGFTIYTANNYGDGDDHCNFIEEECYTIPTLDENLFRS